MGIVNRRNAVLGWAVWKVAKRAGRRKARNAAPSVEGGRPNATLIAATLAGVVGALTFWRKHHTSEAD